MSQPFIHNPDDLPTKRMFLDLAKKYYQKSTDIKDAEESVAYLFAAALLYMNHADYLAQWFAYSIQRLANDAVSEHFYRQISVKNKSTKDINIGQAIKIIMRYDFADKDTLIDILGRVDTARNIVAHTMMKVKPKKLSEVMNQSIVDLKTSVEELINFTDQFKNGMPPRHMQEI